MQLTVELKDKVEAVETIEEKKAIIAETVVELTDDDLKGVAGGNGTEKELTDKDWAEIEW